MKTCGKARIETNDVAEYGDHDHSDNVSNVAAVALRVSCKHSAVKDISQRPSKIIRTAAQSALQSAVVTSDDVHVPRCSERSGCNVQSKT